MANEIELVLPPHNPLVRRCESGVALSRSRRPAGGVESVENRPKIPLETPAGDGTDCSLERLARPADGSTLPRRGTVPHHLALRLDLQRDRLANDTLWRQPA